MLSRLYPSIVEIGGVLGDVPHDGYADPLERVATTAGAVTLGAGPSEPSDGFIRRSRAHWRDAGFGVWFLRSMTDGAFAGWAGLRRRDADGEPAVEFAYALSPAMRCKGHATRIGEEALRLGFDNLGLAEVVATTTAGDQHSLAVLERLGFTYDRTFEQGGRLCALHRKSAAEFRAG